MTASFTIKTGEFDGPLEALLNLIESRKLSVSQVSLAEVCDSYLAYIEALPEMPLPETSQFILVASTLLLIKSRSLLPSLELSTEEKESVEELERRLAKYAVVRKAARLLRKEWGVAPLYLPRRAPLRPMRFSPAEASVDACKASLTRLLSTLPLPEKLVRATVAPVVALEDVIRDLRVRLKSAVRTRWSEFSRNARDRHEVIVHFLAVLELVRSGSASVTQDKIFSEILIESEDVASVPSYGH